MTAKRWLGTLARHYPSLLVSSVCLVQARFTLAKIKENAK